MHPLHDYMTKQLPSLHSSHPTNWRRHHHTLLHPSPEEACHERPGHPSRRDMIFNRAPPPANRDSPGV